MKGYRSGIVRASLYAGIGLALSLALAAAVAGAVVDNRIFGELLAKYNRAGVVDYAGFKSDERRLDDYLNILAAKDPGSLPHDEQFAFYINVYNAWTIKLILSGYPGIQSIKDLGSLFKSPWKKKFVRLNGKTVTLDHLEHDIVRPRFNDPRVHFAINCASKGCPPLLAEPFDAIRLDEQLDFVARRFVNDPRFNRLEGKTLFVSSIFKWFAEDFNHDIVGFFEKYAAGELKGALDGKKSALDLKYLDYDWSLNGK
jgi:hypothetical protein